MVGVWGCGGVYGVGRMEEKYVDLLEVLKGAWWRWGENGRELGTFV